MPNINMTFGADASRVDRALDQLSKKIDNIVVNGSRAEAVLEKAFDGTAVKAQQLQTKVDGITNAFQRMQAQTRLNNLQANFNTGVMDRFVTQLNQMGVGAERSSAYVKQLAVSIGLTKNQVQETINAYAAYVGTLRLGSEEYINAVSNLRILQTSFSELDQSISVSGQNMRSQLNNTEAGLRSMSVNLANIPQQIQKSFENFTLEPLIAKAKADLDTLTKNYAIKISIDEISGYISPEDAAVAKALRFGEDLKRVKDMHNLTWDEMARHGVASIGNLEQALISLQRKQEAFKYAQTEELFQSNPSEYARLTKEMTENIGAQKQLEAVLNRPDNIATGFRRISEAIQNAGDVAGGVNPFSKIIAEQKMSVNELVGVLSRLQQTYNNLKPDDKSFKNYEMAIQAVNAQLNQTTHGTMGGTLALQQLGFAVGDAGMMLTNFRGALMGIGNNLPFVIQGFMQLRQEVIAINATSAVQTTVWKQLVTSLKGPAGILLAVNLGIALFTMFGDKIGEWIGITSKAADAAAEFKKKLEDAKKEIITISMFQSANASKSLLEIIHLQNLSKEYDNQNTKLSRKKQILAEIQKSHPEVIKALEQQKGAEKSLAKAVDATTTSLYNKLKQQLIDTYLTPEYMKINEAMANYADASAQFNNFNADPAYKNKKSKKYLEQDEYTKEFNSKLNTMNSSRKIVDEQLAAFDKKQSTITNHVDNVLKKFLKIGGVEDVSTINDFVEPAEKAGKKQDEYTALEKLQYEYNKKILAEKDEFKKLALKRELNQAEYDLIVKTGKTQEEKNDAEIKFLQKREDYEKEFKKLIEDRAAKGVEEQRKRIARDAKRSEEFYAEEVAFDEAEKQAAKRIDKIIEETGLEVMDDWNKQLVQNEIELRDAKQEIIDNEILSEQTKQELILQTEGKYAVKRKNIEKSIANEKLKIMSNMLGAAAGLFAKHTFMYKFLASAQAAIDTYAAANLALKSYPPPFGAIAMGTVIAQGLANVANIAATEVKGYAKGGLIDKPHLGLVGEAGTEIIAPEKDFKAYSQALLASGGLGAGGGSELVATVKGTDLVFVLQRAEKKVNRQKVGGKI